MKKLKKYIYLIMDQSICHTRYCLLSLIFFIKAAAQKTNHNNIYLKNSSYSSNNIKIIHILLNNIIKCLLIVHNKKTFKKTSKKIEDRS